MEPDKLHIRAQKVLEGTKVGDSIAVNGVCLTVTALGSWDFTADVMPETLKRSSLGALKSGSGVNLERAMAADGRFGGHIVSGHIDGTGTVEDITKDGNAIREITEIVTAYGIGYSVKIRISLCRRHFIIWRPPETAVMKMIARF